MKNLPEVVNRFLTFVKIESQSDDKSTTVPSTPGQLDMAKQLYKELDEIGVEDLSLDDNGYVMCTLPSNSDKEIPTIGFIAHMDTSPDMSGANVNPQIVESYDGSDLVLNSDVIMTKQEFPELNDYIGQDLITTDGTTLLGADDKAGVAEIVTAINYLKQHPEIKHGKIRVGFTPDEEIGRGPNHFDVPKFGADYAYTIDSGGIGELEYENFNAAMAKITVKGRNVHPGYAKNKMINSMLIANEFMSMLPNDEVPGNTDGYEGFFHLISMHGEVEESFLQYIIRDHDRDLFEKRKATFVENVDKLNKKYGRDLVLLDMKDQYYNMKEKIEPVMHIVDNVRKAMETLDIKPKIKPIRGGTDGSRLSFMDLPTPNIFAGGHNFHGKYEFIPIQSMQKAVELIVKIAESAAE